MAVNRNMCTDQEASTEIHLQITGIGGKLGVVSADSEMTMEQVKWKVEQALGVPSEEQQLFIGTTLLPDASRLGQVLHTPELSAAKCLSEVTLVRVEIPEAPSPEGWQDRSAWSWH
eukprot:TRINITY_DN16082_c0_g1_i2.p1 TRINITY_DN16082_c0_g1~~TRINITY_DN16082_c0_g1_i2.p1  ORF type:complete len:116 (-),score=27.64 TRINITY_DN16082_c0_g1_i2:49-396(-)